MWFVHTTGHYSAIKRKEVLAPATRWMNLENIPVTKDHMLYDPTYIKCTEEAHLETESRLVLAKGVGGGEGEGHYGHREWGTGRVLWVQSFFLA